MGTGFFCAPQNSIAVKTVELVCYRMTYRVLRGRWCNIIVLNVLAPAKNKSDDLQDSLYEELEQVFYHFPKYHTRNLLEDFNAKLGRDDIFNLTIGKEILHQESNDNGVRIVNLPHKKSNC